VLLPITAHREADMTFRDGGATHGEGRTTYTEPLGRERETSQDKTQLCRLGRAGFTWAMSG